MNRKRKRAVFVISVAADLAGMHPQTLRIYERRGLIDPYRTPGGTRRYSQDDIDRLKAIQDLTGQGLNLEGVKQVIDLQREVERLRDKIEELRGELDTLATESERRIRETHRSYRREIVLRAETLPDVKR
ncbi:MAG: MerR family transcriptional regulator [Actinobacteria bacterium]|nr:MerR family transcriptional regulator [Actinomycetota bacterium]